ncbi:hypothetical protein K8M07_09445 [Schnuerera sp. xch1]|uniref:hypothetical protein n=1 Tax=Schnuerera sp. xch1 TaxID=2874283 RepID=UPI001CBB0006|nr:hypothetical protein [Schnuerera sp. xch1]MBZ2175467.1 hypothetical protein [Schnuerera sp. xch1]
MKIKSYFPDLKSATETVRKLQSEGIGNAYVDANDYHNRNRNVKTNPPGTSYGESLSDLVLNSGSNIIDPNAAPLTAANPMVSGMAGFEEITDINCCVIVETDDNNSNKAKDIIENMGGIFENPNTDEMY